MGNCLLPLTRKKDGSAVYIVLATFTNEEKAKAEILERQISSFNVEEHADLREAITRQALELVIASAERTGVAVLPNARTYLERVATEVGFGELWQAVRQSVAK